MRSSGHLGELHGTQLGDQVQLAGQVGELEEADDTLALARAEVIAELLEVAGEEPGRPAVLDRRLAGERLGLRAGVPTRTGRQCAFAKRTWWSP